MRCNACWRDLEGRAISTTCGHLLCTEDASKILSNDGACPICDQVLSKSLMKSVDINPNEEWINMVMAGISPQILMKSAYRSVMFYIAQRDLEMQYKMNRVAAQYRQKCEGMQAKFNEKMEQAHTAYQKMGKRCQMMEQEVESLTKDKQELQEKFSEKSRQKRKLDEMYDQLRSEYESVKRTAIQPANNFYPRHQEPDFFSNPAVNMMENREPIRKTGRFSLLQHQDLKMRYGQQDRTVQTRVHSTSPLTHLRFHPILETEEQEDILYMVVVALLIPNQLYETLFSPLLNALSSLVPALNCSRYSLRSKFKYSEAALVEALMVTTSK